ncbi:vancomycin high temperature exclusion protein [Actinomadura sp. HBU206391]|uniref:SanA/YdcF family protein n=1 Tax=Actinomadura sp. HBU206391 TaxID=2731692 RepID=UPI002905E6D2|nr:ElyC/SanA/YdcF family protein [Actinomadura sp. HBU206391]
MRGLALPGAVALLLLGYLAVVPSAWMYASTAGHRFPAERVPAAPVALVFGAGLFGDRPSPFLAGRLDVAARLYRLGKVRAILVTGDNGTRSYDEPTAMRDYLTGHGVPAAKVVLDYAGFDTWDSCVRARRVFGVHRAVVVTQRFHLPRAVATCRAAGIDASGVGHDSSSMAAVTTKAGYARELAASAKALFDLARRPRPRFLGPAEPGVRRAVDG